ncbi:MAG: ComEA family DNA-binding protein [Clostridia bacterium]|jgi:competence protein ComEA|nr:ComEA family DNA-binding protein [Clostridia bacterium]
MAAKKKEDVLQNDIPVKIKTDYHKYLVVGIVMLAIIFGAGVKYARFIDGSANTGFSAQAMADSISVLAVPEAKMEGQFAVSLNGAVLNQGYYAVPEGTALGELLAYVGLSENADTSSIDSAQILKDGDRIIIPLLADVQAAEAETVAEIPVENSKPISHSNTYKNNTPKKITEASGKKININTATAAQLMQLPNIGEKRAAAIIEYRKQSGDFASIANITDVSGIGDKTYEKIKGLICVE